MRYWFYSRLMKFAHKHNWHHISSSVLENGDRQNWCHWCGLRETLKKDHFFGMKMLVNDNCPKNTIILTNFKAPQNF